MAQKQTAPKAATSTPDASNVEPGDTLVETTPIGLSAEQMEKSNSDAVDEIKEKATQDDRLRMKNLTAAFADDPAYANEAFANGWSVEQAKLERYDSLVEEVSSLKDKNVKLKKQVNENAEGTVSFDASDEETGKDSENVSESDPEKAAIAYWNKHENIRAEFSGREKSFVAYYQAHPEEFE